MSFCCSSAISSLSAGPGRRQCSYASSADASLTASRVSRLWGCRHPRQRRAAARQPVVAFSLAKSLGGELARVLPRWLQPPDFDLPKRQAILDAFFAISDNVCPIDREEYEALLAPDFRMVEQIKEGEQHTRTYFKSDFIALMCECVQPSIPDFTWSASTEGEVDKDGYAIVEVQVSGHHTGAPFALPGLPPIEPCGARVRLEREFLKVRVEGERIKEIQVLPSEKGAGPMALYRALGGQAP